MKSKKIKSYRGLWCLPVFFLLFFFLSCEDDTEKFANYDPSRPVEINRFIPDSGGVATQMLIYGKNFGNDTSLLKVFINEKRAPLIGCNDSVIYVLVAKKTSLERQKCEIKLQIGQGTQMQEVKPAKKFLYIPHYIVSTLAGFTDKDGNTAIVDGPIDKAQFQDPFWMAFDEEKNIYLIEEYNGMRFIDKERTHVSTKFRTGNGVSRPRTIAFTQHYDTMAIAVDNGNWTDIGQIQLTKESSFTKWTTVHNSRQCNGGAFHPVHFDYYFNSYEQGQVFKADRTTVPWTRTELFKTGDVQWEFNIQFAPSGNFAYIVAVNQHYIGKAEYDWSRHVLQSPINFVGKRSTSGFNNGSRDGTLFNKPHQGAFDQYDNFYVCDANNHCIRKITPEGIVTTFAGRPKEAGLVNGDLRDAQFNFPHGIIYDKETGDFYVADLRNRCIRVISIE